MRIGSLFSGYGGLDLAVEHVTGGSLVWHSEIDPNASIVHEAHWPGIPNLGDITAIDWTQVEPVDVLCGGFPCQDISSAGRGAGIKEGTRSGLWYRYADAVRVLRPRYVFVENVGTLVVRGLDIVAGDLASLGYDCQWAGLRASDVGAPHRRGRIFLVATNPNNVTSNREWSRQESWQGSEVASDAPDFGYQRSGTTWDRGTGPANGCWGSYVAAITRWEPIIGRPAPAPTDGRRRLNPRFVEWMMGLPEGWVTGHGLSRTAELKMLGNGVVPQQAVAAFTALLDRELVG